MLSNAAGNKKPLDMRGYFASNPNGMYEAIQDPANFPDLFQSLNRDKERCNGIDGGRQFATIVVSIAQSR